MSLFGHSPKHQFLGVDIGSSSIKVVELANEKGRAKVMTYGYAELPIESQGDLFDQPKETGQLLSEVCRRAGVKTSKAISALPTSHIFSSIFSVPYSADKKKIKPVIDTEVQKLSPLPLSEMIVFSTFIDGETKKDTTEKSPTRVLVTGATKTLVQKYVEIFKRAKLELVALDIESFALIRSLVGKDKSVIAIIDMGVKRTNILIVEKGIPFLSRSIAIGGAMVTAQLERELSLSRADAEQTKRDLSLSQASRSDLAGGLPKTLESFVHPILNEIRYAFQLYSGMEFAQVKRVEKIILTGGSSHLPRLAEYFASVLNINVYRGDPWARVVYPQDLLASLEEIGPRMSVAIGLGMREIE